MYQDSSSWRNPAARKASGWPTERATRWSTRSGTRDPITQASADAPVVADHVGPLETQMVEDGQDVTGQRTSE